MRDINNAGVRWPGIGTTLRLGGHGVTVLIRTQRGTRGTMSLDAEVGEWQEVPATGDDGPGYVSFLEVDATDD
jgi:hypothetical protein